MKDKRIERLIAKATKCRSDEDGYCGQISKILIDKYNYPKSTSVLFQESDGYVIMFGREEIGYVVPDNIPLAEADLPYKE